MERRVSQHTRYASSKKPELADRGRLVAIAVAMADKLANHARQNPPFFPRRNKQIH
jgi:hypothetical protein